MKKRFLIVLALLIIKIGLAMAQTDVRGVVVDEAGDPVIGTI